MQTHASRAYINLTTPNYWMVVSIFIIASAGNYLKFSLQNKSFNK
jgi:hypothetical protein